MTPRNQHIIHRQILELELEAGLTDADIREKYQDELAEKMSDAMDSVFEELAPGNEMMLIDKLEIDLGACSDEDFLPLFKTRLKQQLQEVLWNEPEKHGRSEGGAKKLSDGHTQFELLAFFLQNGYFPWWAENNDLTDLEGNLIDLLENKKIKKEEWRQLLAVNLRAAKRLSRQLSFRFNLVLLEKIYPFFGNRLKAMLPQMPELIKEIGGTGISPDSYPAETLLLESVWMYILNKGFTYRPEDIREYLIADIILKLDLPATNTINYLKVKMDFDPQTTNKILGERGHKPLQERKESKKDEEKERAGSDEISIDNAGLVILWPFLQELYETMDLMHKDAFKSEEHQERAVLLTQYLVSAETEFEEPLLALNKVINAWPLKKPVKRKLEMTTEEKEIVQEFLKKVIENWPALKNTSPAALQETFLRRNGLLKAEARSWNLRVERKTVDVLRDQLPWPINIISVPWMDTIIYVKW